MGEPCGVHTLDGPIIVMGVTLHGVESLSFTGQQHMFHTEVQSSRVDHAENHDKRLKRVQSKA